jgi:BMFP domain-containing protein YqiC
MNASLREEIKCGQAEIKSTVSAFEEKMKAEIRSIWSELEEAIQHRMKSVVSCVD